jgi:solute carrier family 35 protein E1
MISIVSLLYCIPLAIVIESSQWAAAWQAASAKLGGDMAFYQLLAWGGLFYHLYNQVCVWVPVLPEVYSTAYLA